VIQVTGDRVAILPLDDPERIGSIWIPDTAKQRIDQGIVIYIGPEVKDVCVGWHVFFSGYAGTQVSIEGEGRFYVMHEDQCMAVLLEDEPDPLFPLSEVLRIMDLAKGELLIRHTHAVDNPQLIINKTIERIESHLQGYFYAEGLDKLK